MLTYALIIRIALKINLFTKNIYQTGSFTHSYTKEGRYVILVKAENSVGRVEQKMKFLVQYPINGKSLCLK